MSSVQKSSCIPPVLSRAVSLMKRHPVIVTPFIGLIAFNSALLLFLFCAPRHPVSVVLSPVIRAFWGEQFLHYPVNFMLLPRLYQYGKYLSDFAAGILLTGIAVSLITQANEGGMPSWWQGLKRTVRNYIPLAIICGVALAGILVAGQGARYLGSLAGSRAVSCGLEFAAFTAVQSLFLFAVPAVIVENRKTVGSFFRSIALLKSHFFITFLCAALCNLALLPFVYVQSKLQFMIEYLFPEAVICVLLARIAAAGVAEFGLTTFATTVLLLQRERENGVAFYD